MISLHRKRTILGLLALAATLWMSWQALPRVLGLAAERWLDIPGLESLSVDIGEIGATQARLRKVRAVYHSAGGHRFTTSLHDIVLGYSLGKLSLQQLGIARGELEVTPGTATQKSPWPKVEWPDLPLDEVRIDDLQVTINGTERRRLEARGSFQLRQREGTLQSEFGTENGLVRMTAIPAQSLDGTVDIQTEWLPKTGPAANALLRVGRDPAAQPATLAVQAALPALAEWAGRLGVDLPVIVTEGGLKAKMEATLGDVAGTLKQLKGNAEVAAARGRSTQANTPLEFVLSGKLEVLWQESSSRIELMPGLQWQIAAGGKQPLQVGGRLDRGYRLHRVDGILLGEDAFPFTLQAQQWGQWEGTVRRLRLQHAMAIDAKKAGQGWDAAEMQLLIKGGVKHWHHGALQANDAKLDGEVALHWSRSNGIRGEMSLAAAAEGLAWSGSSPAKLGRTTWAVDASATAKPDGNMWKTLELKGNARAPQLKIEFGTNQTLTLGPTRLQLLRLRPGGLKGVPSVENAEGELLVSSDTVRFGTWPAPGLQTSLRFNQGRLHSEGSLSLQTTEMLRFSGSHTLPGGCGEATVSARQSLTALGKALQPRPPALLPLDLRKGEAEGHITLDWCLSPTATINAKGTLQLRDAALGWDQAGIEGVQGTLQLESVNPVLGRISLTAKNGELATGTPLSDLNIDLALGTQALTVHALQVHLLGGTVRGGPLTLDWPMTDQPLPLEIRGIDLGLLLALPKVQGLSGSGQLDGVLPFVQRAGGAEIRDGRLSSQGTGTLRYAPTLTLPDNPGLQALRNFHFRQLDMRMNYAADGTYRTHTLLEGSNPDFYNGYPIRFGLNINGALPGLFRAALFSGDFNRHILEQLQSGKLE